jgi:SNF2 family DNA or RNA helicase
MILLHGCVENRRFLLWGETPPASPIPRKGRRSPGDSRRRLASIPTEVPPLPFGADSEALVRAVAEFMPQDSLGFAQEQTIWLPTVGGLPVASSPLIIVPPQSAESPALAPWHATGLPLSFGQAIDLLCACRGKDTLAPGVIVGKTLAYWAEALLWAGSLVAREQFLPGMEKHDEEWRACWKPVWASPDQQQLTPLAKAMPAACRCLNGQAAPPDQAAATVLTDFIEGTVDELVRSALGPGTKNGAVSAPARRQSPIPRTGSRKKQPARSFDSLHDQWLHALRAPEGSLHGTKAELNGLADQIANWQRPIAISIAAPFRLCFRLEDSPANGTGVASSDGTATALPSNHAASNNRSADRNWIVRYLLQSQDDPSLLLPAEKAWSPKGPTRSLLKRNGFDAREYLLAALGQAAGLCPPIETSLQSAAPAAFAADTTEAYQFLTESSVLLEQAGFGVLLPAWWTRTGTKHRLSVTAEVKRPKSQSAGLGLSLDEIIHFKWQVALGDQPLTLQELEALARLKQPLVRVRGQWVQVSAEEIQAALDFWKKKGEAQATVRDVLHMALGRAEPPGGLAFAGVRAEGWVAELLDQLQGRAAFAELPSPDGFQGTLRPYQLRGYSWLAFLRRWGLGACLADDMGLGKTIQTLTLLQRDWHGGKRQPTLLVCPTSVLGNWKKEAERFTPELPVLMHHGVQRKRGASFAQEAASQALVLCSYALLHRDLEHLQKVSWGGVILDEAQNIKNPETKQAQAARGLKADLRIALTGTPVENHVGELWSICEFLNPGFLGGPTEFRRRFQIPIQAGHDPEAAERLKRLTGPFILRRLKTDKSIISDLPDKLEMKVYCNLTKEQASLYAAVVAELDRDLRGTDGIKRKGVVLAALSKLKQVCNHPAQFLGDNSSIPGRSGKLARLTEMLDEVAQAGDRALIFTQFSEMGAILQKHLQETFGQEVPFLHGGVPARQRDRLVARFQQARGRSEPADSHRPLAEAPRFFILSLKAGGTGLNLTAANHVFHFDRWWNPAVENQASDRAFRIGQTRNVQVHKFICVGTLEEKIDEMIERKKGVAAKVVGTGEGWLTELSNEQLRALVALRQEALGE